MNIVLAPVVSEISIDDFGYETDLDPSHYKEGGKSMQVRTIRICRCRKAHGFALGLGQKVIH